MGRIPKMDSSHCCDPQWQCCAQFWCERIRQGVGGKEASLNHFASVWGWRAVGQSADDVDMVAGTVQIFEHRFNEMRAVKQAAGLFVQFADRGAQRVFAARQPAAGRHPVVRAIGMADQQHMAGTIKRNDPAASEARCADAPPAPPHAMCQSQPSTVERGGNQVKHVTG